MNRLLLTLAVFPAVVSAHSTISPSRSFAYSANAGWIHFRPNAEDGVAVHEYHLAGKAYGANFGWIDFGDGTPSTGHIYTNTTATDCGVNHDGAGNLQGFAYSANLGWINFGWASHDDPQRARFDLVTGQFSGYAYSTNAGWIHLSTEWLATTRIARIDSDEDGLGDEWELAYFGNLTSANRTSDSDRDGTTDREEYLADTRATDPTDHPRLHIASIRQISDIKMATLEWPTRATRRYALDSSTTLLPGSWISLGEYPGTGDLRTYEHSTPEGKQFYRLGCKLPLP